MENIEIEELIEITKADTVEAITQDVATEIARIVSDGDKQLSPAWDVVAGKHGVHAYLPYSSDELPIPPVVIEPVNPLRDYQEEALAILKLLVTDKYYYEERHFRELIINLPTGSGKTRIFLELLAWWKGFNVVVIVAPTISLLRQLEYNTVKFLGDDNINYQVVCSDKKLSEDEINAEEDQLILDAMLTHGEATTDMEVVGNFLTDITTNRKILFCTYKSLPKLGGLFNNLNISPDLLIGDEGHRMCDKTANDMLSRENFPVKYKAMFTATVREKISNTNTVMEFPMTNIELFGPVAYKKTARELIDGGYILPPKLLHTSWNDKYSKTLLKLVGDGLTDMEDDIKNEFVLFISGLLYVYKQTGKIKTITFTQSLSVAKWYARNIDVIIKVLSTLLEHPVSIDKFVISQEVEGFDRDRLLRQFDESPNAILFNYQVVKEGIDVQDCNSVAWLRKMDAVGLIQSMGRAMRIDPNDPNKKFGYIICPINIDSNDKGATIARMREVAQILIEEGYRDMIVDESNNSDRAQGNGTGTRRDIRELDFIGQTLEELENLGNNVEVVDGEIVSNPWYTMDEADDNIINTFDI